MTPASVSYKNFTIDTQELKRRKFYPTPASWVRHQFTVPYERYAQSPKGMVESINDWLHENIRGCWTLNTFATSKIAMVIIGFENLNDAVMFRMMDGETAWNIDQ